MTFPHLNGTAKTRFRLAILSLAAVGLLLQCPSLRQPAFAQESFDVVTLEVREVERTQQLIIPTQGRARALILDPETVELTSVSENRAIFTGLKIGYSIVYLWDAGGRRALRIEVTELRSIIEEFNRAQRISQAMRLGAQDRTLRLRYQISHRNLERRGLEEDGLANFADMDELNRVRSHDIEAKMLTPWGRFQGNLFLEQRRDIDIGKEVAQPRHMAAQMQEVLVPGIGSHDFVLGDKDLQLTDFTIRGRRYRGFGIFPSQPLLEERPDWKTLPQKVGVTGFIGQEREGFFLDLPAGTQTRAEQSTLSGAKIEYALTNDLTAQMTGLHRGGENGENRADNVYEFGANWDRDDLADVEFNTARNGPASAHELLTSVRPFDGFSLRNYFWTIGKQYKTVTGSVGRGGQTGWSGSTEYLPPIWNGDVEFSTSVTALRDRNALNPNNPRELNTAYSIGTTERFPWRLTWRTQASYEDQSGSPLPFVGRRFDTNLAQDILVSEHPWMNKLYVDGWLKSISPFVGFRRAEFGKSNNVPGFDATLKLYRVGTRASFWGNFWGEAVWSKARLKEANPEFFPEITYPKELVLEFGQNQRFKSIPIFMNTSIRYEDVQNTRRKTHQPFADRDRISGNFTFSWRFGKESELFGGLTATRQKPETTVGLPVLDLFAQIGARFDWDTGWSPLTYSGRITGSVFYDLNFNGIRDSEEPGVSGVRVFVLNGSSTKTNRDGRFSLRAEEGPQTIRVESSRLPKGYFFMTPSAIEKFIQGREVTTIDFGIATEVRFRGRVYNDANGNLAFDEGTDAPVDSIRVSLESGQSAASAADGYYQIQRVAPGPHMLSVQVESIPDGYQTRQPIRKQVETQNGDVVEFNIPLKALHTVSGTIFSDLDGNGVRGKEEPGIAGVRIQLDGAEAVSDEEGRYRLEEVQPGKSILEIESGSIPPGYRLDFQEWMAVNVPSGPLLRELLDVPLIPLDSPAPVGRPEPVPALAAAKEGQISVAEFRKRFPRVSVPEGTGKAYLMPASRGTTVSLYVQETLRRSLTEIAAVEAAGLPEGIKAQVLPVPASATALRRPALIVKDWMLELPLDTDLPLVELALGDAVPPLPALMLEALRGEPGLRKPAATAGITSARDQAGELYWVWFLE